MNDVLKPYGENKSIAVSWLPSIPSHWSFDKIKRCFDERVEKGYPTEPLLSSTQAHGVIPQTLYANRVVTALKDLHLLKFVEVGDFVISLRSFQGGLEYAYYRGIISPAYTIMKSRDVIDKSYFKHLAKSPDFIKLLQACVTGIREGQSIDYKLLKKNYIPLPPLSEQTQIANYLDYQLAMIDKFVKAKKREVELLKEEIEYICYFGISDDSFSISDWEDIFPKSWKNTTAKRIFVERSCKSNYGEELLAVTQDRGVVLKKDCPQNYVSPSNDVSGLKLVLPDDFVISLRSFQGGIEFSNVRGIVSPAYNVFYLKPQFENSSLRTYYRLLFKSRPFIYLLNTMGAGIRDGKNISFSVFSEINLPIPPEHVLSRIENLVDSYDALVALSSKLISKLEEYRTSLISEVVTGKVDVRAIVVPRVERESMEDES